MKINLFQNILRLEKNIADAYLRKSIMSRYRSRKIIPDQYFIDVITTIPERKPVVESSDI